MNNRFMKGYYTFWWALFRPVAWFLTLVWYWRLPRRSDVLIMNWRDFKDAINREYD